MSLNDLDHTGAMLGDTTTSSNIATAGPDANNANDEVTTEVPVTMTGRVVMAWAGDGASEPTDVAEFEVWGRKDLPAPPVWPPTPPTRYLTEPGAAKTARASRGGRGPEDQVVAGLAEGHTHAQIAEATGKSERTIRRWASRDDIKQRVKNKVDETEEMRANAHREAMAVLSAHQVDAATGMWELAMHAESEAVRLRGPGEDPRARWPPGRARPAPAPGTGARMGGARRPRGGGGGGGGGVMTTIAALERAEGIGQQVGEGSQTARAWRRLDTGEGTWNDLAQVIDLTDLHNMRALIVHLAGWYVQIRREGFEPATNGTLSVACSIVSVPVGLLR